MKLEKGTSIISMTKVVKEEEKPKIKAKKVEGQIEMDID